MRFATPLSERTKMAVAACPLSEVVNMGTNRSPRIAAVFVILAITGCAPKTQRAAAPAPAYIRDYQRNGLPPVKDRVEFQNEHAFPPELKGRQPIRDAKPEYRAERQPDMATFGPQVRDQALRDPRVKAELGERYTFI